MHFTTDRYDVVKHKGRIRVSHDTFMKQKNLYTKLANQFQDEDYVNFLVSNFVSGDQWGGVFDTQAHTTYQNWKKRNEALAYTFRSDIQHVLSELKLSTFDASAIFDVQKNEHPYIIRAYLSRTINIETLVILQKLFNFCDKFDQEIQETFVWPDISRLIRKYSPFVRINKEKFSGILTKL
jgi:hypothetical protein